MKKITLLFCSLVFGYLGTGISQAQVVAPLFQSEYSLLDLGSVPGLPPSYGGLTFSPDDPNILIIGGNANSSIGALYTIRVVRDSENHVIGFDGSAQYFADAAYNDGGVVYGPDGVLFTSRWPVNELGQLLPGSTTTDKVISLAQFGIPSSHAALNFVPSHFTNEGEVKMVTWSGGVWHTADLVPDGNGTFDLANVTAVPSSQLPGGPEGIVYVPPGSPLFDAPSLIVSEWSAGRVAVYEVDSLGNPIISTRRTFVSGLSGAEGGTLDPVTGDFLFSTFGGGNKVVVVKGFAPPVSALRDVRVISTVSGAGVQVDQTSFAQAPFSINTTPDQTVIEWRFDTFQINQLENLDYEVIVIDPTAGEQRPVTQKLELLYIDINGNPVRTELGAQHIDVLPSVLTASVSTDRGIYTADEEVLITTNVQNISLFDVNTSVQLSILDETDAIVADLGSLNGLLAAQGSLQFNGLNFLTASTLVGNYRVKAEVLDQRNGTRVETFTPFSIVADAALLANSRVSTDKTNYHTTDTVLISNLLRNITSNSVLPPALLALEVTGPAGSTVFTSNINVGQLVAGELNEFIRNFALNNSSEGVYTVVARYQDGQTLLASDTTQFTVSENLNIALQGSVAVQHAKLFIGDTQICHYQINNTGTLDLLAQPVWQLLVDVANQLEIKSTSTTKALKAGQSAALVEGIDTTNLPAGNYACVLETSIDGQRQTLAHAVFVLEEPPIKFNLGFSQGDRGRVLLLVDGTQAFCHDDDDDDDEDDHGRRDDDDCDDDDDFATHAELPSLAAQRQYLENTLNEAGWSYTVVDNRRDFSRELRSGGYTVYALMAERTALNETTLKGLREAVNRGDGLLIASGAEFDETMLHEVLSVKTLGHQVAMGIDVFESDFHQAAVINFASQQKVLRTRLTTANSLARFNGIPAWPVCDDDDDCDDDDRDDDCEGEDDDDESECQPNTPSDHAITGYQYGQGRSMFFGFDLLRFATANSSSTENPYSTLLLKALDHVHPDTIEPIVGSVLPLKFTIDNIGIDTPGRVLISLPAGTHVVDSGGAVIQSEQLLIWPFDLASDTSAMLNLHVLPAYNGVLPLTFTALVQSGQAPDYVDYEAIELVVNPLETETIEIVLANINALTNPDKRIRHARKYLQKAQHYESQGQFEHALQKLLRATRLLARSKHASAADIRLQVDNVIKVVARQVNAMPPGNGGDDDDD